MPPTILTRFFITELSLISLDFYAKSFEVFITILGNGLSQYPKAPLNGQLTISNLEAQKAS